MTSGRQLELAWSDFKGTDCLRIRGWIPAELSELGKLSTAELSQRLTILPSELVKAAVNVRDSQPLAGCFEIDGDAICFIPRFPFMAGTTYSLLVSLRSFSPSPSEGLQPERGAAVPESSAEGRRRGSKGVSPFHSFSPLLQERGPRGEVYGIERREVVEASPEPSRRVWTIQRQAQGGAPATEVVAIYPTTDEVPVNQLKLYVQFSGPMSEGWAPRAVHVRRADTDEPLHGVFLDTEPELWDRERRRLTLLLEPGRIKRGLSPHEEAGYPLIEGVPVIVTIDAKFRDAGGRPLRASAERRYAVVAPLRTRNDPSNWRYHYPTAGTTEPLMVEFDRPLDHALLHHSLWVTDAAGVLLSGRCSASMGERSWRFEPRSAWREGLYVLVVDPRLEDLAGNSLVRVFDRDLLRDEDTPASAHLVTIGFKCAAPFTPNRDRRTRG